MADRLDEQLHETCGSIFPHSLSSPTLARRLPLVPGKAPTDTLIQVFYSLPLF